MYVQGVLIPDSNGKAFSSLPDPTQFLSELPSGTTTQGGVASYAVTPQSSGGSSGAGSSGGSGASATPATSASSSGSSGSVFSASGWLDAIGKWLVAGSSRVVLIILGILLIVGAMLLFAAREAEGVSPVKA